MADSTLQAIRNKVRRLTRTPSTQQMSDATIDEYINTSILYDFPSQLRLFSTRKTFTFWTIPNVSEYQTITDPVFAANPLYQFQEKYITTHEPIFIGGFKSYFTQSQGEFFGMWPKINSRQQIGVGDGVTTVFTATAATTNIQPPVVLNNVTFSAIATNNQALVLHDVPVIDALGNPTMDGNLYVPGYEPAAPPAVVDATNTINYLTGAYTVTFKNDQNIVTAPSAASSQNAIWSQVIPYSASIPTAMLFYDNKFTLRPVPDISYPVQLEVYVRPTELITSGQSPQLQQWWQYIALMASKKVYEDRMDQESVQMLMPNLKEQELFVLRTTLAQEANQSAPTIYRQQSSLGAGPGGWWGGL